MDCAKLFEENQACCKETNDKDIVVKENNLKFRIDNKNQKKVIKVTVDNCLIKTEEQKKCDYLFEIDSPIANVFYVELKGHKIEQGCKQLENTIHICKDKHRDISKTAYIVCFRVPKQSTDIQNLKKQFIKQNKCKLEIATNEKKIEIE